MTDERATTAVVGKALEAALVVLYVGILASALFGGAVPEYRSAAGAEVGERVLAEANQRVQQAVPANASRVQAQTRVDLPQTIRGREYEIQVDGRSLVLDHPDPTVSRSSPLALPKNVGSVEGNWTSREPAVVTVERAEDGLFVRLMEGS